MEQMKRDEKMSIEIGPTTMVSVDYAMHNAQRYRPIVVILFMFLM